MSTVLIELRRARSEDAVALAEAHDEAWTNAYRGIIPGPELEKLVQRRGPTWWDAAIRRGSRVVLLNFGDEIAGYANYGRNRAKSLPYTGEVYELEKAAENEISLAIIHTYAKSITVTNQAGRNLVKIII